MGVNNDIFWSEVGSGFGEPGCTPPPRILRSPPREIWNIPVDKFVKGAVSRQSSPFCLVFPITRPQSLWNLK